MQQIQVPRDAPEPALRWLRQLFAAAVDAVAPARCLPPHLPSPPRGRTVVVGAGKAAAAMARAVEDHWQGPLSGLVVTRYGHGVPCDRIEVLEAAHPMPDDLGVQAAVRMLRAVEGLGPDDLVLALISGGGSALMTLPAGRVSLAEKQRLSAALLRCGAPIAEINTVRRHLSAIKGGRLAAAAHPARVMSFVISDVPGDDPRLVASGPTLPDASTPPDALAILERYGIEVTAAVREELAHPSQPAPRSDDPAFAADRVEVVARARDALEAARRAAERSGVAVDLLGDAIEGEAREVGRQHARLARERQPAAPGPLLLLSGGETSVTVRGDGRGGRNAEYLLGLVEALDGAAGIYALAADTDGIDGSETNAGAVAEPATLQRARQLGLSVAEHLARNDAYGYFERLGDLVITGPTRTNVNDFRAVLVMPR